MGIRRRIISELDSRGEGIIISQLKKNGYNIESVDSDESAVDKGLMASIFIINDKKVLRLINEDTGFSRGFDTALESELGKYQKVMGNTNDFIVNVYFAKHLLSVNTYVYVLERLEKIYDSLDYEFTEFYDKLFGDVQIHNKITYVPNDKQMNIICERIYDDDYDERFRLFENLSDEEQKVILDTFRGIKELRDKFDITFNDLHIGNIMKAENGNYKIIDFGM